MLRNVRAAGPCSTSKGASRPGPLRAVPSARSEALQQLAQFQSGIRQQLDTYEPARPVSPPRMQVVASASASADVVTTEQPTAAPTEKAGLLELNAETFWPHLESAGDDLVVVDFFTDWVSPCCPPAGPCSAASYL
jgi:hypothetical protein